MFACGAGRAGALFAWGIFFLGLKGYTFHIVLVGGVRGCPLRRGGRQRLQALPWGILPPFGQKGCEFAIFGTENFKKE